MSEHKMNIQEKVRKRDVEVILTCEPVKMLNYVRNNEEDMLNLSSNEGFVYRVP